jgi:hypothetical protein
MSHKQRDIVGPYRIVSIVSFVSNNSGALNLGGPPTAEEESLNEAARRLSTETVRRSSGFGLMGSSRSLNSDC